MSQPNQHCIGIDIAKLSLDIAGTGEFTPFTTGNDDDGFRAILKALKEAKIMLILMEATGGLEASVACSLQGAGY